MLIKNWALRPTCIDGDGDYHYVVPGIGNRVHLFRDVGNKLGWDELLSVINCELSGNYLKHKYPLIMTRSIYVDIISGDLFIDGNLSNMAIGDIVDYMKETGLVRNTSSVYSVYPSYNEKVGNVDEIHDIINDLACGELVDFC